MSQIDKDRIIRVILQCEGSDNDFNFQPPIKSNKYYIEWISIPHLWSNFPYDEYITFIDSDSREHILTISSGNYISIDPIIQSLVDQMNKTGDKNAPHYFKQIDNNNKIWQVGTSFVPPSPFKWIINSPRLIRILGWEGMVNNNFTAQGRNWMLSSGGILLLESNISSVGQSQCFTNLGPKTLYSNLSVTSGHNIIAAFPVQTQYGEIENYYLGQLSTQAPMMNIHSSISFRLRNEDRRPIDPRDRWYIGLIFYD